MGELFTAHRVVDSNGAPVSGAVLYFYETGTTTAKKAYPTEADVTADTNGFTTKTADGNGLFPYLYGIEDSNYTITLKDSSGNTIWTDDDVEAKPRSTDGVRYLQAVRSPMSYGAAGDGATNDAAEIQAAIDAAESDGTNVVDLLGLTYRCDTELILHSGLKIQNGTLDFSNLSGTDCMSLEGSDGTPEPITANASRGDTTITPTTIAGFSADDIIICDSGGVVGNVTEIGFITKIESISGSDFLVDEPIPADLLTADSAQVRVLTMASDLVLQDLKLIGNGTSSNVRLSTARDVLLRNVQFSANTRPCVEAFKCLNVSLENCSVTDGSGAAPMLAQVSECSRGIRIIGCDITEQTIGIYVGKANDDTINGFCRDVTVSGCRITGCSISSMNIGDDSSAIGVVVDGCDITGFQAATDGRLDIEGYDVRFCNNRVAFVEDINLIAVVGPDGPQTPALVASNNIIRNMLSGNGMYVSSVGNALLSNNIIDTCTGHGIEVVGSSTTDITAHGNKVTGAGTAAFIVANGANSVAVTGNCFKEDSSGGNDLVEINGAAYVQITGNSINKTDDTGDCILLSTVTRAVVGFNVLNNGDYGINASGCTEVQHAGNIFVGQGSGSTTGSTYAALTGHGTGGISGTLVETT